MARIPESFIQDVLNRVDIVDVVEKYLPLKKAGQNYQACCPFHKEKSPSFTVSPSKQFYHCFGCGAHGSAIGFVMEYEGLNYPEAIRKLAEGLGMVVPVEEAGAAPAEKAAPGIFEVLKAAFDFYRAALKKSPEAIAYFRKRGVEGKTAARFGLGYAPGGDDWQALKVIYPDYDWNKLLTEAGLVIEKEDTKRRYDRFRDRVMFPIFNQRGAVIGFGGRVLGQGEPKYLNSPETPVFEKGRELYGLTQARAVIRERNRVLVTEGYMDVVMLHQHGVEYAVASLGTACTPEHVKKLLKLADEVVFGFDGDKAGRRAAWRALENAMPLVRDGKEVRFLFLPPEHDPDSYVQEFGREAFERLIDEEALPLSQYLLRELSLQVDLTAEEGRAKLWHIAHPYLDQLQEAPVLRLLVQKRLGELCQLSQADMSQLQAPRGGSVVSAQSHYDDGEQVRHYEDEYSSLQEAAGSFRGGGRKSGRAARSAAGAGAVRRSGDWRAQREQEEREAKGLVAPPPAQRAQLDPMLMLFQLVLCDPGAVAGLDPVESRWPQEGRLALLAELLTLARSQPQQPGSLLLEFWRERPEFSYLEQCLREGLQLYGRFPREDREQELRDTCLLLERLIIAPQRVRRRQELDVRRENGGLTELEKQEYLQLLQAAAGK
ncbi:DNA primase [Chitinilyticum piscinae]|uniref:DNA primase n=1 Tax=Chitinilyticum piscinae TaxID=2866724 RepID=A0A8J7K1D6_9NEIS|nr:DNA primase [Chitinilyticum piscinae]MBE9608527.1 DNA primase [Chitinilyticum piscinae]